MRGESVNWEPKEMSGHWRRLQLSRDKWASDGICDYNHVNISLTENNDRYLTDDVFKCIAQGSWLSVIQRSQGFVPKGPNDRESTLVQVMVLRHMGDIALPGPMITSSLKHMRRETSVCWQSFAACVIYTKRVLWNIHPIFPYHYSWMPIGGIKISFIRNAIIGILFF